MTSCHSPNHQRPRDRRPAEGDRRQEDRRSRRCDRRPRCSTTSTRRYPGFKAQVYGAGWQAPSLRQHLPERRGHPLHRRRRHRRSRPATSSTSCPRSPAELTDRAAAREADDALPLHPRPDRQHAARGVALARAPAGCAHLRQARRPEPDRLGEGPHRQVHDRGGREARANSSPATPSSSRPPATPASASR